LELHVCANTNHFPDTLLNGHGERDQIPQTIYETKLIPTLSSPSVTAASKLNMIESAPLTCSRREEAGKLRGADSGQALAAVLAFLGGRVAGILKGEDALNI
jgi:hypothetical protein